MFAQAMAVKNNDQVIEDFLQSVMSLAKQAPAEAMPAVGLNLPTETKYYLVHVQETVAPE